MVQRERGGSPETTHVVSGQPIQLLPNVKHIPAHLLGTSGENSGNSSRSSTPVNHSASPVPAEMSQAREGKASVKDDHRSTPVSELSSSPADHAAPKEVVPEETKSSEAGSLGEKGSPKNGEEASVSSRKNSRKSLQHLSLETGFSRQFSDDLPTPTEIKNIIKMIDQSDIEEGRLEPAERVIRPLTKLSLQLAQKRQMENALIEMNEADADPLTGKKMSYAGALKRASPSPSSFMEGNMALLDPQTPRTPSGFTTPGADIDMDPLGILKSLNIEIDSQHREDFQHFP